MTRYGLYKFVWMGFGLCNAPATFSWAMNLVLLGLTWNIVLAFLDDALVLGKDFEDHLVNLRSVLPASRNSTGSSSRKSVPCSRGDWSSGPTCKGRPGLGGSPLY